MKSKLLLPIVLLLPLLAIAQSAPRFEVDPTWPKPLPEGWITGQLGGVCTDSHDHIVVVNRRDITKEEAETSQQAPPIIMFDQAGNVVASFGDPNLVPHSIHGCAFDSDNNVWVGGNDDGILQKYSHDGKLLTQIGTRGTFDTSDGTSKGAPLNASHERFFNPAGIAIDPGNGDIYVADGYGNRRVAVFDRSGKFLRQWGRQASDAETQAGEGGVFSRVVHCIALGDDGLVYVCDRQGDRIQVFDKTGKFQRNIWIRTGTPALPDPRGTAWWVAFSRDPQQRYMFVMNGRNERFTSSITRLEKFWRVSDAPDTNWATSSMATRWRSIPAATFTSRRPIGAGASRDSSQVTALSKSRDDKKLSWAGMRLGKFRGDFYVSGVYGAGKTSYLVKLKKFATSGYAASLR